MCVPHLLQHVSLLYGLQHVLLRCLLGFTTQYELIQNVIGFLKVEDNVQFTHLVFKHREFHNERLQFKYSNILPLV